MLVALVSCAVLVAAGSISAAGRASDTLVWVYPIKVPTPRWALETDDAYVLTTMGVAEPLVGEGVHGELQPALATSWKQTSQLSWRFTLRKGVTFQNGKPYDSATVVNALNHVLHVSTPPAVLSLGHITSVQAAGKYAVVITTGTPDAIVPAQMSAANLVILAPDAYQSDGSVNPVGTGTGPFTITSINLPQSVSLKANPHYWGGKVRIPSVETRFILDGQTRASLGLAGEAQIVTNLPPSQIGVLRGDKNLVVQNTPIPRFTELLINNKKPPFDDVRVRRAIQSAINVSKLAYTVGAAQAAVGPFRADSPWAPTGAKPVAQSLAKARALLQSAGVDPTKLTITLLAYAARPDLPIAATAIQGMLQQLGINVKIRVADYAAIEPDMTSGTYDLALLSRNPVVYAPDPLSFLTSDYSCSGTFNLSHYCNKAIDALITTAAATPSEKARNTIYATIARNLQANAVDVFLYNPIDIQAYSKNLKNYRYYTTFEYMLTKDLALG